MFNSLHGMLDRNELSFKSKPQLKFATEILANGLTPPLNKFAKKTDRKVPKGILRIYEYMLFGSVHIGHQGLDKEQTIHHQDINVIEQNSNNENIHSLTTNTSLL